MATTEKDTATKEAVKKEKMVKIRLPKTKELQDDVYVSVNQRNWLIKRGESVEVPACVAEVLQNSENMASEAMAFDSRVSKGDK